MTVPVKVEPSAEIRQMAWNVRQTFVAFRDAHFAVVPAFVLTLAVVHGLCPAPDEATWVTCTDEEGEDD